MRKLILLSIVLLSLYGVGFTKPHINNKLVKMYINELNHLTEEQKYILETVYRKGLEYDVGYTAVAIAWQESKFGVYCINPTTGDYGVMGINLLWYMKDNNLNYNNYWLRQKIATKLVRDDDFNIEYGISRILYWYKKTRGNWFKTWARYNGGNLLIRRNYLYANQIFNRIVAFRKWLNSNN